MNIFLKTDYKTCTLFCPVYSPDGQLTSVGMLTHFTHVSANVAMPQEILTPLLNEQQRVLLLQEQINVIEKHYDFFSNHEINVAINIDKPLAEIILDSEFILKKMYQLDCIELEVNESFPDLNAGKNNIYLKSLSEKFSLCLNNYGSGRASSKAVYDDLFYRIKLDKTFIQHNINRLSFPPFIRAILDHIKPHCHQVVVQGVDDLPGLQMACHYPFDGIQSALFPTASEEALHLLIDPPYQLREHAVQ